MKRAETKELPVIACIPFDTDRNIGFALPIFSDPKIPNVSLIQEVDEYLNVVATFRKLDGNAANAIPLTSHPLSKIGRKAIYSFLTEDGVAHVGTLIELNPTLRSFVKRCPQHKAISLQILELVGDKNESRTSRIQMRNAILKTPGSKSAALSFEDSSLRSILWDRLVSNAPSREAAHRILAIRSSLDVKINERGDVELCIEKLSPDDYSAASLELIRQELVDEIQKLSDNRLFPDQASFTLHEHSDGIDSAFSTYTRISKTGRQEERIAIILDEILKDREIGREVLNLIKKDRAKYASLIISDLRYMLQEDIEKNRETKPVEIVSMALEYFLMGMPNGRAMAFFHFAKHLSKYDEIKSLLAERFRGPYQFTTKEISRETMNLLYK